MTPIEAAAAALQKRLTSPAWADQYVMPAYLGPQFDGLAADTGSPALAASLAALRAIKPRHKLAVLATLRNEATHIAEFIAHYRAIGVAHFFIYTNDNTDGTDQLLRWFEARAPVSVITQSASPGVNVQHKAYTHALYLLPELRLYEWVLVVDGDEFLTPDAAYGHALPRLLDAAPADTEAIAFPWRWRLWAPHFERQPGPLHEIYPHAAVHDHVKSVSRLRNVTSLHNPHFPTLEAGIMRDSAFAPITGDEIWAKTPKTRAGGVIDHYWGRSFEEYAIKKHRTEAVNVNRDYAFYFSWTEPLTPGNLEPVPAAMRAAAQLELDRFAAKPSYQAIRALVEQRYQDMAAPLRQDAALREIYNSLYENRR